MFGRYGTSVARPGQRGAKLYDSSMVTWASAESTIIAEAGYCPNIVPATILVCDGRSRGGVRIVFSSPYPKGMECLAKREGAM